MDLFPMLTLDSPVTRLKIFGERNAGTNYVEAIVAANLYCDICPGNLSESRRLCYKILQKTLPYKIARLVVESDRDWQFEKRFQSELGWKHARIPNLPKGINSYPTGTGFIAVVKNPYAWLLSLHARPYHNEIVKGMSFSDFLREPWPTVAREYAEANSYANPVQMWCDKVRSYERLTSFAPSMLVRYEDVLVSVEHFVQLVSHRFNVKQRASLVIPSESTKKDGRSTTDITSYYIGETWRKKLSTEDIRFVNENIDVELVRNLGYRLL